VLAGQTQPPPKCETPQHRAFDYWVGEWTVHDTAGTQIAESSIRRVAEGCAISEEWRPIGGPQGVSISWYNPADQQWHQQWVGGGGWIAWFDGNPEDGNMTLTTKPNPANPGGGITRMVYSQPRTDVVLQSLYVSQDGGKTWQPNFKGEYRKMKEN
jgi:hypothetical protein